MSEETTPHGEDTIDNTPQGDDTQQPQGPTAADVDFGTEVSDVDRWKREARKHESRAKRTQAELADLRKQLEQMVSPEKVESVEAQAVTERQAREQAEKELTRYKVAVAKGLTEAQAKRLVGDNEDELMADAEVLLAELGTAKPKAAAAKEGSNASGTKPALTPAEALKVAALG